MRTIDIFKKHFGDKVAVSMYHQNMLYFYAELAEFYELRKPTRGDRILIKNVPADYPCRDLYLTEGQYIGVIDHFNLETRTVSFTTGYTPYLDAGRYTSSGGGYGIEANRLRFLNRCPAKFWRFKDGIPATFNGENYELQVNYFECEFEDIKR